MAANERLADLHSLQKDALYESQPCPKGCDAECKAIDPEWNENALKMFGFKVHFSRIFG